MPFLPSSGSLVIRFIPLIVIIANIIIAAPPKTLGGIIETNAPSFGKNPARIKNMAPVAIANLFTTPVIATNPTFWLKEVLGRTPNKDAKLLPSPSAITPPDNSLSVASLLNPLVGKFSDFLVAQGGTTILTEVPEMFGAETLLMARTDNEEVFNKTVHLINDFKEYFMQYNQPVYENPSPGNKAGGITTLEDKSLGCTQKAGTATVIDVLKYGEALKKKGLNLLSAPGNDLVAASALAASGCQMVLFTTGRGTPFGSFVPTMKISTNTEIYKLKPHWIDFNAGSLLEDKSLEALTEEFIEYVINVASGELVNNEKNNFRELAIFKNGVTL